MKNSSKIISLLMLVLVCTFVSYGAVSFTANPSSFSVTQNVSSTTSYTTTLTNTGDQITNITILDSSLTASGKTSIPINFVTKTFSNVNNQSSVTISFSLATNNEIGTFTGNIVAQNSNNSAEKITIPVTLNIVSSANVINPEFIGFEGKSTLPMELDVDDSTERERFYLKNNGNVAIENIELRLDDLEGEDDEIRNQDVKINGEDGDDPFKADEEENNDDFKLLAGEEYEIEFEVDIPTNLDADDYEGDLELKYSVDGTFYTEKFTFKVIASTDEENVYIRQDYLEVQDGILEVTLEQGDNEDVEFVIKNEGSNDLNDLEVKFEGNLEEASSSNTLSLDNIKFDKNIFDVDKRDSRNVEVKIEIPENQATGTYTTNIELYSNAGDKKDEITLRVKVIGDVYIKSLNYNDSVKPDEYFDIEIEFENRGTKLYTDVSLYAIVYDVNNDNDDIDEELNNFVLESKETKKELLRLKIPDDAEYGGKKLEVRLSFGDDRVTEIKGISIDRPAREISLENFLINPKSVKCENSIYVYSRIENEGRYDEDVKIITSITGTSIKKESSTFELETGDYDDRTELLDISNLERGDYTVTQRVEYGSDFKTQSGTISIGNCGGSQSTDNNDSIIINTLPPKNDSTTSINDSNSENIDDNNQVADSTVYILLAILIVVVLIIIGLLFLL